MIQRLSSIIAIALLMTSCQSRPPVSPLVVSPLPTPTPPPVNLLANPSFEEPYNCTGNKCIADGWSYWYLENMPCNPAHDDCPLPCPANCTRQVANIAMSGYGLEVAGSLAMSETTQIVVSLNVTQPVRMVEARLHYNPPALAVNDAITLADGGRLAMTPAYIRYQREISYSVVGREPLFAITVTAATTDPFTLELIAFLGTPAGGWYNASSGWSPGIAPVINLASTVSALGSKCLCARDPGCCWATPEFSAIYAVDYPNRVCEGETAQKYFAYKRMYEGGLYQQVSVTPGDALRFSVYVHAWHCFDLDNCCSGECSDEPARHNWQVGIDPTGGTNPLASSVIWSPRYESFDVYSEMAVVARAVSNTVTVFIKAAPALDYARHCDSYVDDAELIGAGYSVGLPAVMR